MPRNIFIDPSYTEFYRDGLFNLADPALNRDGQLLPFHRMRANLVAQGHRVHTADRLFNDADPSFGDAEYYSLGIVRNYASPAFKGVRLRAFVIMEPAVVAPELYAALPMLTRCFERVYVHNTQGDGYSLVEVDQSRLRRLYLPAPFPDVLPQHWHNVDRLRKLVLINGKHLPRDRPNELYAARIDAAIELGSQGHLDLFGKGWDRWRDKRWLMRPSYWAMRHQIARIYKGPCDSKYEVMSRYAFCLCFENMVMRGYISEKILDCFYSGTVPIYLGAQDIRDFVPIGAFVDARMFCSWNALWSHVTSLSQKALEAMREEGAAFLRSDAARPFFTSADDIVAQSEPSA